MKTATLFVTLALLALASAGCSYFGQACDDGKSYTYGDHCDYADLSTQLSCFGAPVMTTYAESQIRSILDNFLAQRLAIESASRDKELLREGDTPGAWIRLAFHAAGTFLAGTAGFRSCDVNFCTNPLNAATCDLIGDNKGLEEAIAQLENLWRGQSVRRIAGGPQLSLTQILSRPDFWAIATARAVTFHSRKEEGETQKDQGLLFDIKYGRFQCPPNTDIDGRLPNPRMNFAEVDAYFTGLPVTQGSRLTTPEWNALLGAHTMGRAQRKFSGQDRAWTKSPAVFDSQYYHDLFICWKPEEGRAVNLPGQISPKGIQFQLCNKDSHRIGDASDTMMLPVDMELGWSVFASTAQPRVLACSPHGNPDCPFPRENAVQKFRHDQPYFFQQFKSAFTKLHNMQPNQLFAAI